MLSLTPDEAEALTALVRSRHGAVLLQVLERFTNGIADVRNVKGVSVEVREVCVDLLEKELLAKLKQLRSKVEPPDKNEYT